MGFVVNICKKTKTYLILGTWGAYSGRSINNTTASVRASIGKSSYISHQCIRISRTSFEANCG